jgi:hippurate hydrolase
MLAGVDDFEIELRGQGGHAAMPHLTHDVVPALAHIVLALQTLVSREIDPLKPAVVSVTNVHAGSGATNVLGDTARLSGTVRTFDEPVRLHIEQRMRAIAEQIAAACRVEARLNYKVMIAPTVNHADATAHCRKAAANVAGSAEAVLDMDPVMGGEDFGGFLDQRPGAFMVIGQGEPSSSSPHNQGLHSPFYDFNDSILPTAAEYFAELAESRLPLHL